MYPDPKWPMIRGANTNALGLRVYNSATDPISDISVGIDIAHHQIHEGETHQYTYSPTALANGDSLDHRLVVGDLAPTTRTPHFVAEVDATAETWVYLYETPTTSGNGTQQTVRNRNRNSSTTPNMTVWLAPTVSNAGTLLGAWIIGAGNKTGGGSRESLEWDLKANTVYLVRVTAKATGNTVCQRYMWYEDLGV
jgi:hypothetical protein